PRLYTAVLEDHLEKASSDGLGFRTAPGWKEPPPADCSGDQYLNWDNTDGRGSLYHAGPNAGLDQAKTPVAVLDELHKYGRSLLKANSEERFPKLVGD